MATSGSSFRCHLLQQLVRTSSIDRVAGRQPSGSSIVSKSPPIALIGWIVNSSGSECQQSELFVDQWNASHNRMESLPENDMHEIEISTGKRIDECEQKQNFKQNCMALPGVMTTLKGKLLGSNVVLPPYSASDGFANDIESNTVGSRDSDTSKTEEPKSLITVADDRVRIHSFLPPAKSLPSQMHAEHTAKVTASTNVYDSQSTGSLSRRNHDRYSPSRFVSTRVQASDQGDPGETTKMNCLPALSRRALDEKVVSIKSYQSMKSFGGKRNVPLAISRSFNSSDLSVNDDIHVDSTPTIQTLQTLETLQTMKISPERDAPKESGACHNAHITSLAQSFQLMLQTRRTAGRFLSTPSSLLELRSVAPPLSAKTTSSTNVLSSSLGSTYSEFWRQALERAAIAGCSAPNHKKTEPFTFFRIVRPSRAHTRLADIAYYVSLWKLQQQHQLQKNVGHSFDPQTSNDEILLQAERKRDRWMQVPAFLVVVVNSHQERSVNDDADRTTCVQNELDLLKQSEITSPETDTKTTNSETTFDQQYVPCSFVPLITERELEDYAASCAAVQNCLLSLHSENLASKWVTGPIVKTMAFRQLFHAQPNDRVVALVMVGGRAKTLSSSSHSNETTSNTNENRTSTTIKLNYIDDEEALDGNLRASTSTSSTTKTKAHFCHTRKLRRAFVGDLLVDL